MVLSTDQDVGCSLKFNKVKYVFFLYYFVLLHKSIMIENGNQPPQIVFITQKAKTYGFSREVFGYIIHEDKENI